MINVLSNLRQMAQESRKEQEIIRAINNNFISKEKVKQGIIKIMDAEANGSLHNGYKKSKRNIPYYEWMKEALLNEL
jgi:hypothetical protein